MNERTRDLALVAVGLIGCAVVAFVLSDRLALPDAYFMLVPAALTLLGAAGLGIGLLRVLGAWHVLDRERWMWACVLGVGTLGTAVQLLAHMALFRTAPAVVLAGVVIAALHGRALVRDARPVPELGWGFVAALAPCGAWVFARASLPPTFYDALVYHLGLPMQFAARGAAIVDAHDSYTAQPLLTEMAASPALLLGGPVAVGFFYALLWALFAGAICVLVRRAIPEHRAAGAAAAWVAASMPLVVFLPGATKPDLFAALLAVVVLRALGRTALEPVGPSLSPWWRIGAVAVGFGCAAKTQFLLWAVVLAVVVGVLAARRRIALSPRDAATAVVLATLAGALPWVRNALALSNPFFPFAAGVFGGPSWLAHTAVVLDGDAQKLRSAADLAKVVQLPWTASVTTDPTTNEAMGLVWLLGVLAMLALGVRSRALGLWAIVAALTLPPWFLTHAELRYDPFLWITAAVGGGLGLSAAARRGASGVAVVVAAGLAAAIGLVWSATADEVLLRGPAAVLVQREKPDQLLRRALEGWPAYQWLNGNARGGCVFLATGDPRVAYLEVPAVLSEVYSRPLLDELVDVSTDPADLVARIRATGATHVLLGHNAQALMQRRGWAKFDARAQARFDGLAAALGAPVYEDGLDSVFMVPMPTLGACASR